MQQIQIPPLAEGETYIGGYTDENGEIVHFAQIGENDEATWEEQMALAKAKGGDLPNRIEQAIKLARQPETLQKTWYWSNETVKDDPAWAWLQYFYHGDQDLYPKSARARAFVVRRFKLPI